MQDESYICEVYDTLMQSGKFGEVDIVHVAGFGEFCMEFICGMQCGGCLSSLGKFQVIAQYGTVVGVCAVFYDFVCALQRIFRAQIRDTLVCDEYVD